MQESRYDFYTGYGSRIIDYIWPKTYCISMTVYHLCFVTFLWNTASKKIIYIISVRDGLSFTLLRFMDMHSCKTLSSCTHTHCDFSHNMNTHPLELVFTVIISVFLRHSALVGMESWAHCVASWDPDTRMYRVCGIVSFMSDIFPQTTQVCYPLCTNSLQRKHLERFPLVTGTFD